MELLIEAPSLMIYIEQKLEKFSSSSLHLSHCVRRCSISSSLSFLSQSLELSKQLSRRSAQKVNSEKKYNQFILVELSFSCLAIEQDGHL